MDSLEDCECSFIPISLEKADRGIIPGDRILYKLLKNTVDSLIDVNHEFYEEVIEFFNTIEYLGGESSVNFLRGPMCHGSGKGGIKNSVDAELNLGGPSKTTRQKRKGGYTIIKSGVFKELLLGFLVLESEGATKVIP